MLYEILKGKLPLLGNQIHEIYYAVTEEEPEPLPSYVPFAVRNIVIKSLEKEFSKRYQTASEMRQDLQSVFRNLSDLSTIIVDGLNESSTINDLSETVTIKSQISQNILIPYRKGDKWGFCNEKKNILVEPKYDDAVPFSEGLAGVRLNNKYGYIDKTGQEITPLKYDEARSFDKGFALVWKARKAFYIDKNGTEYYEP